MAIRQYVGARYVPRFTGLYDATQQYEALDVVDNGSGTSYIAKKTVPAGTPLTNTDYWFIYGASSGAIINLQNQVDALNLAIGDLSDLQTPITDSIVNAINSRERKFVFITDSYGYGPNSDDGTSIISHFCDKLGLTEDVNITSLAYGGWGFISDGTKTFLSMLTTVIWPRFSGGSLQFTADEVTDVIVCGGCNDSGSTAPALYGAIKTFVDQCKIYFPHAKVWVGEVGNVKAATAHINIGNNVMDGYMRCIEAGANYLSGIERVMLDTRYFMPDGVHPNGIGMKVIGYGIAGCIYGSAFETVRNGAGVLDLTGNAFGITSGTISATSYSDGDMTTLLIHGSVACSVNFTVADLLLGTLPDNLTFINGNAPLGLNMGAIQLKYTVAGVAHCMPANMFVNNGNRVYITPGEAVSGVSGMNLSLTNIKFNARLN